MGEPFINKSKSTLALEEWQQLEPNLVVGFTTKHGGESSFPFETNNLGLHVGDNPQQVRSNRRELSKELHFSAEKWVCAEQVHGDQIVKVTDKLSGQGVLDYEDSIKSTDGFYTNKDNILLTLCYADCVPIYFFSPDHHMIGIAHAGWKGTVKNISGKMIQLWDMMEDISPSNVQVVIGPSIGSCCYVVDEKVIKEVNEVLEHISSEVTPYKEVTEGQYLLDLKTLNKLLLLHAGVEEMNVNVSTLCTSCNDHLFFSHRRDKGKTGRMLSYIGFQPSMKVIL
ncbi:peptidoglycan editing factor PgeF [Salipaludibacillus daqingensis]|uniref:peptidoglycan editing factor PgeF n=1 Tax=Salipaludibacillus daqingensis TaxID=3041001 RepID=UPI0024755CDF|nr:peptidoglycan editing factor PgeF [Salipaludibacillus daqingensis]